MPGFGFGFGSGSALRRHTGNAPGGGQGMLHVLDSSGNSFAVSPMVLGGQGNGFTVPSGALDGNGNNLNVS